MAPRRTRSRACRAQSGFGFWLQGSAGRILTGAMLAPVLIPAAARSQIVGPSPPTITTTVNVASGVTTIVGSTAIATTGATNATNVTGGSLNIDALAGPTPGPINLQTVDGHALLANGAGSHITIGNGAAIALVGNGAALAAIGGTIDAAGLTVAGGLASHGYGAIAESGGTINLHAGNSITTGGAFNAVALGASGASSRVNADALVPVTMNGRGAMGVYMHDGGQVSLLTGSTLLFNANSSVGVTVDNSNVALGTIGSGLTVNLNGPNSGLQSGSTGVVAVNGGRIALQDLTVTGNNASAGVWAAAGSSVTLSGASVLNINATQLPQIFYTLTGPNLVTPSGPVASVFNSTAAGGISVSGLFAWGGSIISMGTSINVTASTGASGAYAGAGGTVNMVNNTIVGTGAFSYGILADANGLVTGRDSRVTVSGGAAALVLSTTGGGTIDLANTTVLATGAGTRGLISSDATAGTINTARLSGGSLISVQGDAVTAKGPLSLTTSDGAVVTGGGGNLLKAQANDVGKPATAAQFNATGGSVLTGNAFADALSTANMALSTGSVWTGAALAISNATVDATSTWNVTANSTLTGQLSNAGLVAFTAPVGGVFKTVTPVNYIGAGGTLGLNTFLGTDGSPSDRLVINGGTATGNSRLRITNAGGAGVLTTGNGILVVDAINGGTTAPGSFALSGRPVAGPYEYALFRSSVDASNTQGWYLRSNIDCRQDPTNPVCPAPGPSPGPERPDFRPETSLYAAIPSMALLYGRTLLDTLHERVGDEEDLRNRPRVEGVARGAWGRVIGQHGNVGGDPFGVLGSGPKFNYDIGAFQGGQDLLRRDGADGSRDHAGIYTAVGALSGGVSHDDHRFAGSDRLNAYSLGGYWTHFGAPGWYLDAMLQGTWYDAKGISSGMPALTTNGWGLAGSLEAGYPIRLGGGFLIEPQAQFVYQNIRLGDGSDPAATVQFRNVESVAARVGARFARTWTLGDGGQPRAITAWVRPSVWNEFRGAPQTLFSSADGPVAFGASLGGSWFELNAGINAELTRATSLFATAGYQVSSNGNNTACNGKMGLRMAW